MTQRRRQRGVYRDICVRVRATVRQFIAMPVVSYYKKSHE
jgi:DNA-binding cell septation regulator SpoVG